MKDSTTMFELRKALVIAVAIVYGCKIIRSGSQRINKSLINSSVNDVLKIMKLVIAGTRG